MRVETLGERRFRVVFAGEAELRAEEGNLAVGGLFLRPAPVLPPFANVELELEVAGAGAVSLRGRVVATPPGGVALQLEGEVAGLVDRLLAVPVPIPVAAGGSDAVGASDEVDEDGGEESGTLWERLRNLTPPQKQLLAPKADRVTRALLLQDSDPMVTFALLKNPRLSIDEVVRIAKSPALGFQAAELILKTSQWAANLDVRLALVHNPKTALPLALRILPTLPESDVRYIARGNATSQALKQAALRRIHPTG